VSYQLFAWPVDRAMTTEEAIAEIHERSRRRSFGLGREQRVASFAAQMDEQFPEIGSIRSPIPMEFEVHRTWVFLALPWSMVTDLIGRIAYTAFEQGLALYDPQREIVALPAAFGDAPLALAGVEEHQRMAAEAMLDLMGRIGVDQERGAPFDGNN